MDKLKYCFNKIKPYLIYIYIFFVFISFLYLTKNKENSKILILIETIFFVILFVVFRICKKKKLENEKTFIIIYFLIGLTFLFSFPIGSLPDEVNHFLRGYEISKGHLISEKVKRQDNSIYGAVKITSEIHNSINSLNYKDVKEKSKIKYDKTKGKYYYGITNISMYSFVCYIPQAIGILIGRIINTPIMYWGYLARLSNFIIFCILSYLSLKYIPYKKLSIMVLLTFPMTIQNAISMSADSITIASSLLLISYVLKLREEKQKINKKDLIILFLLSFIIALSKIVYLPLVLITLLIPKEKFETKKKKYITLLLIISIVSILNLMWLKTASEFLSNISDRGISSDEQLKYIFSNIGNYIIIILRTYKKYFALLIRQLCGNFLGSYNILINSIPIYFTIIILIFVLLFDNDKKIKINKWSRLLLFIIVGMIIGLISTSLYLDWTEVKGKIIEGIQGRYFTPIVLYFSVIISNNKLIMNNEVKKYLLVFMLMFDVFSFINILSFY